MAEVSARHPKRTITVWVLALLIGAGLTGGLFKSAVTTEFTFLNGAESKRATTLLEERLRGPAGIRDVVIVRSAELTVDSQAYRTYVERLRDDILGLGADLVVGATSYYETGDQTLVSEDRHTTILPITVAGDLMEAESNVEKVHDLLDRAGPSSAFELYITGEATFSNDFTTGVQEDIEKGEAFGVPIAMIILAVVFGALAAAVLPVVLAIGSIVIAIGLASVVGQAFELHLFVQNMITMIGLAVGIDYSLFIVSRYREERSRGLAKIEAISAAGSTAGRAVLFSGLTVVLALLGLLIVPQSMFVSMGIGAILVVAVAVLASLTLLPAVLSIMGDGVNRFRVPLLGRRDAKHGDDGNGFWDRVAYSMMRRPVVSLVLAGGLLLAAAVPYFDINTGTSGVSTFPDDFRAKEGFEVLLEEFGFGLNAPAEVVVAGEIESAPVQEAIDSLRASLATDPAFGPADLQSNEAADLALLSVPVVGDATSEDTLAAVRRLRDRHIPAVFAGVPAEVLVTGQTAEEIDFNDIANRYLPIVVGIVLATSFVLLSRVPGSSVTRGGGLEKERPPRHP